MRTQYLLAVMVGVILVAGCTASDEPTSKTLVEFEELATPGYNAPAEASRQVIRSQEQWQELWQDADREPPSIDFDQRSVIAVHMGEQSTGGYSIDVESVRSFDGNIVVDVREVSPGRDCIVTQALTRPYQMVSISATERPVKFNVTKETRDC
jgi:hypothetical protein